MNTLFYHIKNLQSTKTVMQPYISVYSFITLRIYKVLKLASSFSHTPLSFITLRIYKVLKQATNQKNYTQGFITLRIYKVLKRRVAQVSARKVLSH